MLDHIVRAAVVTCERSLLFRRSVDDIADEQRYKNDSIHDARLLALATKAAQPPALTTFTPTYASESSCSKPLLPGWVR